MTNAYIPSPEEIKSLCTPAGGWTKAQLAQWGVPWPPPKGWKHELERKWRSMQDGRSDKFS